MPDATKATLKLGAVAGAFVTIIGMFGYILKTGTELESRLTRIETILSCHVNPSNCGNPTASR